MGDEAKSAWIERFRDAFERGVFAKLTLSQPLGDESAKNVYLRPVSLKAGQRVQWVWRYERRDRTVNLDLDASCAEVDAVLGARFGSANLSTTEGTWTVTARDGRFRGARGPAAHAAPPSAQHDRARQRVLAPDVAWLHALDLVDADGRTRPGAQDKRRQVDRFIEILHHLLGPQTPPADGKIRVVDMGCGKGYLTFATWEYLRRSGWKTAEVVGIEARPELAAKTEHIARRLGFEGLSFRAGTIADTALEGVDVVIALHACDTATDDALAAGVFAGARWLVVAPCCHREVRPQLHAPEALRPAWKHGILAHREAEIATDALRAALLEVAAYDARVFEFIAAEHTDKNLMITAVRRTTARPEASAQARALAGFYGVTRQHLALRLGVELGGEASAGLEGNRPAEDGAVES